MVSSKLLGLSNPVPFLVPQKVEHPACQSPLSAITPAVPFNSQYGSKDVASSVSLFPATSGPYENEDIGVLTVTHSRPASAESKRGVELRGRAKAWCQTRVRTKRSSHRPCYRNRGH